MDAATFDGEPHRVALEVLVVRVLVEKNEYGLVDAILRIVKQRLHIITRIHEIHELV